jgi:hypothetical protein
MTFAAEEAGQILSQDARGRVLVSRERRESLLEEYDRSGMSGVKFAQYVGIKYSTLAYWLQSRRRHRQREKLLLKAGVDTGAGKSTGGWIEAVVEEGSPRRVLVIDFDRYINEPIYAKCRKLNERLSSIHTLVVSRRRGGTLSLASSDHIHCNYFVVLEKARRG